VKTRPWHPYLFGLFPILFLYAQNAYRVPLRQIIGPIVVVLVTIILLIVILNLAIRNVRKTALIISVIVIWFFSWKHLADAMPAYEQIIAYGSALVVIAVIVATLVTHHALIKVTGLANVISLVLVVLQIGLAGWGLANRPVLERAPESLADAAPLDTRPPNIYYIVLDGYGRADVLAEIFNYDSYDFPSRLKGMGFYVADSSRSNYSQTQLSLTSSLNLEYLDDLAKWDRQSRDRTGLKTLYDDNRLFRFLERYDYSIVSFYTAYDLTQMWQADYVLGPWYDLSEFSLTLIQTTPLEDWVTDIAGYGRARERILFTLDRLPRLGDLDEPHFVFAHIMCPHPPFLWDADGNESQPDRPFSLSDGSHYIVEGGSWSEYVRGYKDQVRVLNRLLTQTLDTLLSSQRDNPPVIILQGDHGSGKQYHQISLEHTDIHERFPILTAYSLPGIDSTGLYSSISPVNSFRVVLNAYFGTDYPLLEDRSFYSPSFYPFRLTDVTDSM